jgi:hypothetical protein
MKDTCTSARGSDWGWESQSGESASAMQPLGESSVITSPPIQTGAIYHTHAKVIGPRQIWHHWRHSQWSKD